MKTALWSRKFVAGLVFLCAITVGFAYINTTDISDGVPESTVVDTYDFRMRLRVPRIYGNSESLGSRKYQTQNIYGEMLLAYDASGNLIDILFTNMVNKTHRLSNGSFLTYPYAYLDTDIVYPRFNVIGSNKTGRFNVASICFYLAAEPSYNIGEFDEDNALYVMLAGKGSFRADGRLKLVSGKAAGTLGCGCTAYGHVSPTRRIGRYGATDNVDDVAAVDGTWSMRFNPRKSMKR